MARFGPELEVGSVLDQYRIEAPIARGGMGVVYQARDLRLNRKVALKVLAPELVANDEFRRRFVRESQLAAAIDHPNIIPIYGAGESDQLLWIAMRFVQGVTLRKVLEHEPRLPLDRTVAIHGQVAKALDAAHLRGLVHRDVKPGNVLLVPSSEEREGDEHVYLGDFGLTKRQSDDSGITKTRQFLGTVDYMAPEQIQAQPIDGRADVYSLACMFYECLAGTPPFSKSTEVATIYAQLSEAAPSLAAVRPELGTGLDAVLQRALAKSRDDRYPTAGAMMAGIRGALRTPAAPATPPAPIEPISVPPASFSEAAKRLETQFPRPETNDRPATGDEAPTLEPTDFPADITVARLEPPPAPAMHPKPPATAEPVPVRDHRELHEQPTIERRGETPSPSPPPPAEPPTVATAAKAPRKRPRRRRWFVAATLLLVAAVAAGGVGWVLLRKTDAPQGTDGTLSPDARLFSVASNGGSPSHLLGDLPAIAPSWWPAQSLAIQAFVDGNWDIYVVEPDGTGRTRLTTDPEVDSAPAWSPDGKRIAFVRHDAEGAQDIWVMNADGSGQRRLTTSPSPDLYPSWSPDGRQIAYVSGNRSSENLWLMNADGSDERPLTESNKDTQPSWGPNGVIAFIRGRGAHHDLFVIKPDGTGLKNLTPGRNSDDLAPAWSPDGARLAFVSELDREYEVWIVNADGTNLRQLTFAFDRVGRHVAWSPDGESVLFSATGG